LRSIRAEREEAASWGWPGLPATLQLEQLPPDIVRFTELLKRPETEHKSLRELLKFLERFEYPYIATGRIPLAGYQKTLSLRDDKRRTRKRLERKRNRAKSRKKSNKSQESLGDI
jgi:hypothetical protein